jgi:hypothetical protein
MTNIEPGACTIALDMAVEQSGMMRRETGIERLASSSATPNEEVIVARAAQHGVSAAVPEQPVIAAAPVDHVISIPPRDGPAGIAAGQTGGD